MGFPRFPSSQSELHQLHVARKGSKAVIHDQVTILVIDDEQTMREGCSRILSKKGWSVLLAENGEKGLSQIQTHHAKIDAVLLDLMMPGVSGMDVLEQTRDLDSDLPVIVITGYATVESAVEAMKKGAYDFIPKPFTPISFVLWLEGHSSGGPSKGRPISCGRNEKDR